MTKPEVHAFTIDTSNIPDYVQVEGINVRINYEDEYGGSGDKTMIQKQDVERLKELYNYSKERHDREALLDPEDLVALENIIAHLDQPFQWGEPVIVDRSEYPSLPGRFLCMQPDSPDKGFVWHGNGQPVAWAIENIRHPKQTVQVTLDKEIVEAAKGLAGEYVIRNHYTPKDVCKALAIAQEEGEE